MDDFFFLVVSGGEGSGASRLRRLVAMLLAQVPLDKSKAYVAALKYIMHVVVF